LQAVYLRGTTYLRTPLFGIIPVVTLFVVCAGAVVCPHNGTCDLCVCDFLENRFCGHITFVLQSIVITETVQKTTRVTTVH